MTAEANTIKKKFANYAAIDGPTFDSLSKWGRYRMGWVSGRITLDARHLWFAAHSFAHGIDPGWSTQMADPPPHLEFGATLANITAVRIHPWVVGSLVEIRFAPADTVIAVRCHRLTEFVEHLQANRGAGRPTPQDSRDLPHSHHG